MYSVFVIIDTDLVWHDVVITTVAGVAYRPYSQVPI